MFAFLIKWCINLYRLFNAKAILGEEQQWHYLTHSSEVIGRFNIFLKDICLKVNVIAPLEFELVYFESAVQHFSLYTTETHSKRQKADLVVAGKNKVPIHPIPCPK